MSERLTDVVAKRVNYVCDKCGKGDMVDRSNGVVLLTYPAQYSHECTACGNCQLFTVQYPRVIYVDV